MNPTEEFIEVLTKALNTHSEKTGTYIREIHVDHIDVSERGEYRRKQVIGSIGLEIS